MSHRHLIIKRDRGLCSSCRVRDIQHYDSASRGSFGALMFPWHSKRSSVLTDVTYIGCIVIIAALAVDPFAQQILHYNLLPTMIDGHTNVLSRLSNYYTYENAASQYQHSCTEKSVLANRMLQPNLVIQPWCHLSMLVYRTRLYQFKRHVPRLTAPSPTSPRWAYSPIALMSQRNRKRIASLRVMLNSQPAS